MVGETPEAASVATTPTLHEEMLRILCEIGRPLPAAELRRAVLLEARYRTRSGHPVAVQQIHARVHRHPELFTRTGGMIGLADPAATSQAPSTPAATASHEVREEWHWEGNIQARLCDYLEDTGWVIERTADTASGERGIDIVARLADRRLGVEVKGFPSRFYARGPRRGEVKRTHPNLQARHWLADAIAAAIRARSRHPEWDVAIALPDHPAYVESLPHVEWALVRLGIGLIFVPEHGEPRLALPHRREPSRPVD